jgi:two-component SAPR family response regulator
MKVAMTPFDIASSQRFNVHVLGHFRLLKDDMPIEMPSRLRKPQELLQALIAFGGEEVGAAVLIDALWPDSEGDAAYHALESALYRLRKILGAPDAVRMTAGKVTLDSTQFWVDKWEVEQELQRPLDAESNAVQRIGRIRELYDGHFLEHSSDKPWALNARHALRDRILRAIRDAAGVCERRSRWQEAADLYRSGLELDSLNEDLYRGLMVCHQQLGDYSEALQAYRRCRELLTRFLGIPPNSKTLALYHSVRERACADVFALAVSEP